MYCGSASLPFIQPAEDRTCEKLFLSPSLPFILFLTPSVSLHNKEARL